MNVPNSGSEREAAGAILSGDAKWSLAALLALTYAIALVGGWIASRLGLPLAWMLGPFFACGLVSVLGVSLRALPFGRQMAQITIGLGIGLRFTSATLLATLLLTPSMLAATIYVIGYTMLAAALFGPLAGVNRTTAFFATAAGGVADMALIARDRDGDAASVGIVHALRVSMTVAIIPLLVVSFGQPGEVPAEAPALDLSALWLFPAFAAGAFLAWLVQKTSLPNPWLVAPMFLGIVLGATGTLSVAVPSMAIVVAQLLLGTWLGCQFRRELLLALPRVAMAGIAVSLFMISAAFVGALALSGLTGLSLATSFLSLAPAAVTEMVLTAKIMHLDPEVITGFHVMRIFIICSTALLVYRVYCRLGRIFGPAA